MVRNMTTLQTEVELTPTSISTMCTEAKVEGGIADIMDIDLYCGLAGTAEDFDTTLLSRLNFTESSPPIKRALATKESNVMTLLFKGTDELFDNEFSLGYTLAIEDMISIYIINPQKKAQVELLLSQNLAFKIEP